MKSKWKNNLGLKIVAFLFAGILWWAVANVDDPVVSKKFKTTVEVTHSEVITNNGKSFQIEEDMKEIVVTVRARRSVAERIVSADIKATADCREMQDSSIPIRIAIKKYEGKYVEASANPQNVRVKTEDTEKKTLPITVVTMGEVREGYVLGEMIAKPQSIDISGPKSLIGRIEKVVAKIDVSELSEKTTVKAQVIYYDSAENILDHSQLSSNCDKKGVKVEVNLLNTKSIPLEFDTSKIRVANGYIFKGITVEPEKVLVYGEGKVLSEMESIRIAAEALAQKDLKKATEVVVDIANYLPEGVKLPEGEGNSVVVHIMVEKSGTKSVLLPVRSVQVNNMPDNLELAYGPEQEIGLNFSGTKEELEKLTESNIVAMIDLKEYQEEGIYNVPVQIIEMPKGCTYTGKVTVQVILSERQEEE